MYSLLSTCNFQSARKIRKICRMKTAVGILWAILRHITFTSLTSAMDDDTSSQSTETSITVEYPVDGGINTEAVALSNNASASTMDLATMEANTQRSPCGRGGKIYRNEGRAVGTIPRHMSPARLINWICFEKRNIYSEFTECNKSMLGKKQAIFCCKKRYFK